MYEPELFPGLIYQTPRRGVVAHVFCSGRVRVLLVVGTFSGASCSPLGSFAPYVSSAGLKTLWGA